MALDDIEVVLGVECNIQRLIEHPVPCGVVPRGVFAALPSIIRTSPFGFSFQSTFQYASVAQMFPYLSIRSACGLTAMFGLNTRRTLLPAASDSTISICGLRLKTSRCPSGVNATAATFPISGPAEPPDACRSGISASALRQAAGSRRWARGCSWDRVRHLRECDSDRGRQATRVRWPAEQRELLHGARLPRPVSARCVAACLRARSRANHC